MAARMCAGLLPPCALSQETLRQRAEQARPWFAALAAPAASRPPFLAAAESVSRNDRRGASGAIASLAAALEGLIDETSARELSVLAGELASA